jgi:glutathione S-transferase
MSDDDQLVLYDCHEAPSARRARMFVAEKGRSILRVNVDILSGDHQRPEYLAINPVGLVPALKLPTGDVITENDGIAAYLEAVWPDPPLLGRFPLEKGRIAQWNARIELEGLLPTATFGRNSHPSFAGRATPGVQSFEQIPELVERSRSQVEAFLPQLEAILTRRRFVAGDDFSYADITGIIFVDLVLMTEVQALSPFAAVRQWWLRGRDRVSYAS